MTVVRFWLADRLVDLVRIVHPAPHDRVKGRVWQIIEVPRRITETEAREIQETITDL